MASRAEAENYCRDLVRDADRDRYLASLFAPDETRPHVQALYGFNVELPPFDELQPSAENLATLTATLQIEGVRLVAATGRVEEALALISPIFPTGMDVS